MNISVVIPVYNSAETLGLLTDGLLASLEPYGPFQIIFIDDASRDNSWQQISALKAKHPHHITAIRLSRNSGQHNAISCGLGFAKGEYVVTMDDDLQHPPAELPKLIHKIRESGADVVYGDYIDKRHSMLRNAGSRFMKSSSRLVQGNSGSGSSLRIFKKNLAEKILQHQHQGFFFIDEIIHWYTGNIASVPVEHHPRKAGKSGYTIGKLSRLYLDILVNYTAVPLRWMTWFGLIVSVVTFLLGVRYLYLKLHHAHYVLPGFTATIVAILFSTSILMFCMGIIGQYMYKLYQLQHRKPPYSIDQVL